MGFLLEADYIFFVVNLGLLQPSDPLPPLNINTD